jgi:hypothetical protein
MDDLGCTHERFWADDSPDLEQTPWDAAPWVPEPPIGRLGEKTPPGRQGGGDDIPIDRRTAGFQTIDIDTAWDGSP